MDTNEPAGLVSVIDVAEQLGVMKQTVFKVLKRLNITAQKMRDPSRRNSVASFITTEERQRVNQELATEEDAGPGGSALSEDAGFFYIIQLEPAHDPGRIKLGFTISVAERLRKHRCSAPFAMVVCTFPCRRTWERAAIDCVSVGSEQLHTEVFRLDGIEVAIERAEKFFGIMPTIDDSADEPES